MNRSVMISSTMLDLEEYRTEVHEGCDRIGFGTQNRMENLGALDATAVEASLDMVANADIYICILAHRYGFQPPGSAISITEMEYNKAVELEKPRLVFFINEDHPFPANRIDKGDDAVKLRSFKDRASNDRVSEFFTDPKSLRAFVVEALSDFDKKLGEEAGESATKSVSAPINELVKAWAENGTWKPFLHEGQAVDVRNAKYWDYGKYVEIKASFSARASGGQSEKVGLIEMPFSPDEDADVKIWVNGKEENARLVKHLGIYGPISDGDRVELHLTFKKD